MTTLLLKLGGNVLEDVGQLSAIASDLKHLHDDGVQIVLVHGGGPQATRLSKRLGLTPKMVGGRRVTDADALEVTKMVLAGQLNVNLTCAMRQVGLSAVGLSGVSASLIQAVKRPPRVVSGGGPDPIDFGHVGDIVGVNADLLRLLLQAGHLPVMNSLGANAQGEPFNINADIAATRIAAALQVDHLILLSGGVAGVLRDKDDPDSRIPSLTPAQARAAIADGTIQGGMIPKVEESLEVLDAGVGAIHIMGAVSPGTLLKALDEPGAVGTVLLGADHS